MSKRLHMRALVVAAFIMITVQALPALAEITKEIKINSKPEGAEVSLLQGTRRLHLGTTPFKYELEFHSEISIIRMEFKKAGYESKTVEVSAKQEKVDVNLIPQSLSLNPDTIKDPTLRSLQQRLGSTINRVLPELLTSRGHYEFELGRPVCVTRLQDKVFLVLSIELGKSKEKPDSNAQNNDEIFLKSVWDQFSQDIVIPLGKLLPAESTLKGILLDVGYTQTRPDVKVSTQTETHTDWECVPGQVPQEVYDPCSYRSSVRNFDPVTRTYSTTLECVPGTKTVYQYNPCATRRPVTRTEVKFDRKPTYEKVHSRAQYVFPLDLISMVSAPEKVYSQVGLLFINDQGETVIKRGFVPPPLPIIPRE